MSQLNKPFVSRRQWLNTLGAAGAGAFAASVLPTQQVLAESTSATSIYNVMTYGAKGDAAQDDTKAFQSALDAAGQNGGGIVFAPRGSYKIYDVLTIPAHTTLLGTAMAPAVKEESETKGTTLLAYAGRGNEQGTPFITLDGINGTIRGLTIYYPEQSDPQNIVPYPWTIRAGSNADASLDNLSIQDVMLINAYLGVDFGTWGSGRHFIRGLYGQPIKTGIFIDKCLDIGRIEDVHFWPFWSEDACLTSARMGEAFTLRQTDSQFIHNCFAWGYHRGMHLLSNDKESGNTPNGLFTNISFDGIDIGIEIEGANYVGVDLTNVFIACLDNYGQTTRTAIIGHDNIGPVSIVNGSFWGAYKSEIIRWDGGGPLTISSSQFRDWKAGDAAIRINGGRAIISGNSFQDTHGKSVYIDSKADRVIIANNLITGNPIDNHGTQTAISNNL